MTRARRLHVSWVTAGRRRPVSRALAKAGFTQKEIAELLEVSTGTVQRDLKTAAGADPG